MNSDSKAKQPAKDRSGADRLITVLSEMMNEMGRNFADGRGAILDASLDRDLGFDSLSRMELVHRAETEFGVTLPDDVIGRAETPAELLRAITAAAGAPAMTMAAATSAPTPEAAGSAPKSADTLNAVLAWHAQAHPGRTHIRLLLDQGEPAEITYGDLWNGAREFAAGLIAKGLQTGEPVIVMLPTGKDYFNAFFGVLLAGGIPVPVYPPGRAQQLEEHVRRHGAIADNARAAIMITVPEAVAFARLAIARAASLRAVVTPDELKGAAMPTHLPNPASGDAAFIQYTSGSTGDPKGVVLSHANLLANIRAMGERLEVTPHDVFVSWLPLYHDMGLIGAWLGSLTYAMPLVLMAPLSFLARPQRWLWAISNYKGTISGGPNFAYEACQARIIDADLDGCDLSSWRVAFCGAEPIHVPSIESFMQRFAGIGFARTAMMPVYGLAENSVGLTFPTVGRGPRFDRIDAEQLARTGAAEITSADDAISVPSCGYPISGHQLRIVDEGGRELPDRRQGRLQFQGPSASSGYLHNAEATKALFDGDWLNSGDLGYSVEGEIYITGRVKDLIIRGGRNIHPVEIEAALSGLEGLRSGGIAVFGSPDPASATERLIVMAETRRRGDEAHTALEREINARATDITGEPPDRVLLVAPRTVPKTSSGKIRRAAARHMFESGAIDAGPASLKWQKFRIAVSGHRAMVRRGAHRLGGASFAFYVGAAIVVLAPLAWLGVALLPVESWRWRLVRGTTGILFSIARIKITTEGLGHLPTAGPIILAANHSSYLDGAVLAFALGKPLRFVAKAELSKNPITRIFLNRLGSHFVERFNVSKSLADAGRVQPHATSANPVVYFPEGTLSRMAGLLPFQTGAFLAATESQIAIAPVVIRGSRHVLRDGTFIPRPGRIQVRLLTALQAEPAPGGGKDDAWWRAIVLRDRCRAIMLEHCGEPDLRQENLLLDLAARRTE